MVCGWPVRASPRRRSHAARVAQNQGRQGRPRWSRTWGRLSPRRPASCGGSPARRCAGRAARGPTARSGEALRAAAGISSGHAPAPQPGVHLAPARAPRARRGFVACCFDRLVSLGILDTWDSRRGWAYHVPVQPNRLSNSQLDALRTWTKGLDQSELSKYPGVTVQLNI